MEYKEAKEKFISTWGSLGTLWGINKATNIIPSVVRKLRQTFVQLC